jgi:hypothetical protein
MLWQIAQCAELSAIMFYSSQTPDYNRIRFGINSLPSRVFGLYQISNLDLMFVPVAIESAAGATSYI